MASSVTARNRAVDGEASTVTHVSLHSADPGTTGASELAAGTAGYARVAKTYGAAANGSADIVSPAVFNVSGGATVSHWGAWDGTTFLHGGALNHAPQSYAADGTYTLNSAPYAGVNPA